MIDQVFLRYDVAKYSQLLLGTLNGLIEPDEKVVDYLKSLRHGLWNRGYQFVSVRLRGVDYTYNVAETQYTAKGMYFKIAAPSDESVPFDGLFEDGNGLFVGRSDPRSFSISIQNPAITEICLMLKPTAAEQQGILGQRVDANGNPVKRPMKTISSLAMLGALSVPLGYDYGK